MIEALLHNKLSVKQENMEDILTSNVFGLLKYVTPELGLLPFLAKARTLDGDYPLKEIANRLETLEYEFWPRWACSGNQRFCEPDIVLYIKLKDNFSYIVCIEAKYRSGKSSCDEETANTEMEEQSEEKLKQESKDQLVREWNALCLKAKEQQAKPILIYLTAHVSIANEEIEESLRVTNNSMEKSSICWLSWRELSKLFYGNSNQHLADIGRLSQEKMELNFFNGITPKQKMQFNWRFQHASAAWNFRLASINFTWTFSLGGLIHE